MFTPTPAKTTHHSCASGSVWVAHRLRNKLFPALVATHRPLTAQRPLHSGWSKCYRRSSGTGPREPQESRSEPEGRRGRLNLPADGWGTVKRTAERRALRVRGEILQQSGRWCECSPRFWPRLTVSRSALSSWAKSELTYLKTRAGRRGWGGGERDRSYERASNVENRFQRGRDGCSQMAFHMSQEGARSLSAATHPARQSQSHACQIQPAWCSSRRSRCCPWSWPGFCPAARSRRQSCRCRTRLRRKAHF